MSRDLFNLFQDYNQHGGAGCDHHESGMNMNMNHKAYNCSNLQGYDDPSCMSFTESLQGPMDDYNSLARAFGLSPSSSEVCNNIQNPMDIMTTGEDNNQEQLLGGDQLNPHSSVSSSSTEAGAEEDSGKIKKDDQQPKGSDDGGSENSKKGKNEKKKGEKRVKEPRFAFMTKSEVDHLEDGYRWRKYGQKAVKNSPYPRSYYRCTAQKCTVKKRVERSYQDPATVITTYEGQHSHPLPTTLRGNMAGMYSHSMLAGARMAGPSYAQDLLFQMPNNNNYMINNGQFGAQGSFYPQMSTLASLHHQQHQQHQFHQVQDNGLLQDIVPSMFLKHDDH